MHTSCPGGRTSFFDFGFGKQVFSKFVRLGPVIQARSASSLLSSAKKFLPLQVSNEAIFSGYDATMETAGCREYLHWLCELSGAQDKKNCFIFLPSRLGSM